MSDLKVTREKVFAAAEEIRKEGKIRVSNKTIRDRLGGGSPNDICPLVREWLTTFGAISPDVSEAKPLQDRVTQAFTQALELLRQATTQEAKATFDARTAELAEQVTKAKAESDSAVLDYFEADSELQTAKAEIAALQLRLSTAEAAVDALQRNVAQRSAEANAATSRGDELRLRVDDLKRELQISHRLQQDERDQSASLRDELARVGAELEATRLVASTAASDLVSARSALASCQEGSAKAEVEAAAEVSAAALECEAARRDAREQAEVAARLRGELDGVQRQADEFMAMIRENAKMASTKPSTKASTDARQS